MAKHWSTQVYVLCWSDVKAGGRRRMSWHHDRNKLAQLASEMPDGAEPVMYDGFGRRVPLSYTPPDGGGAAAVTRKKRGGPRGHRAIAA